MHSSVECSEDIAYTTPQALAASVQVLAPELRPGILASLQSAYDGCQIWDVKAVRLGTHLARRIGRGERDVDRLALLREILDHALEVGHLDRADLELSEATHAVHEDDGIRSSELR